MIELHDCNNIGDSIFLKIYFCINNVDKNVVTDYNSTTNFK